jgi:hypothetical protein
LYAVTSSLAIIFWSISIVRNRTLARGLGIYGCVIGAMTLLAVVSDRLGMDVHGFKAVVLGQAIWFVAAGALLWRQPAALPSQPSA